MSSESKLILVSPAPGDTHQPEISVHVNFQLSEKERVSLMETPHSAGTPSHRPISAADIEQVLDNRPALVIGRGRGNSAGASRRGKRPYQSFKHRRPKSAISEPRRRSSLPDLNGETQSITTLDLETTEDVEAEVFPRGDPLRSTSRIRDRIKTFKREQRPLQESHMNVIDHFRYVKWPKIKSRLRVIRSWELWKGHMKEVEGHFGTAVVSYFIFLRWLFIMNIVIFALWFGLVIVPNIVFITVAQPPNIPSTLRCSYDNSALPSPNYTCAEDFDDDMLLTTPPNNSSYYQLSGPGYSCNSTNTSFNVRTCLFERQEIGGVSYSVAHQESTVVVALNPDPPAGCVFANASQVTRVRLCASDIDPHVEWYQYVIDFFLGQGIFNDTLLFHGRYSDNTEYIYNLPLAFLLLIVVVFAISVFLLVYNLGQAYNESYVQFGKKRQVNFCNKLFTAWDYNITDSNTAKLKKVQIKTDLVEELDDWEQRNTRRSVEELVKVIIIRIFTNLFTVLVLVAGGVAIFFAARFGLTTTSSNSVIALEGLISPVLISTFNIVLPFMFSFLAQFERFKTQSGEIKMTLARAVIVRLSSLIVQIITLYIVIQCRQQVGTPEDPEEETCQVISINITDLFSGISTVQECPVCWETYIGQEFYKLALINFLISAASTILVETGRNIVSRMKWKGLGERIGKGTFNIPKSILDLIYTQALLWLGFIFTPLSPAIIMATTFMLFYVKKYSLILNLVPSKRKSFRAARTNFTFILLMLGTLFLVILVVGFAIGSLRPSSICGPFRGRTYMYSIVTDLIAELENCAARQALDYFGSIGFLVPVFILLLLVIYAQQVTIRARKNKFNLIKKQLLLEGANVTHIVSTLDELVRNTEEATDGGGGVIEQPSLGTRMKRISQQTSTTAL